MGFGLYKIYIHIKNFELAVLIYSNGIVEELVPIDHTFSYKELTQTFFEYETIETSRLPDIPNTWCVWGDMENPPEVEFNKIGTEIVETEIFSHLMFVHDSEIDPTWGLTDKIIQKSYKEWMEELAKFTNSLIEELSKQREETSDKSSMIFLTVMGHTKDKRVLYALDPNIQDEEFYNGGFDKFAHKIYEYLQNNFYKEPLEENKPFVAWADSKAIVIVENEHLNEFVSQLIKVFEKEEKYEMCKGITEIKDTWNNLNTLPIIDASLGSQKKKRGRPPKNEAD